MHKPRLVITPIAVVECEVMGDVKKDGEKFTK
jgi:hypothetical protein